MSAPGLDGPATIDAARRRHRRRCALTLRRAAARLGRQPLGQHRAHVRDAHACTSAGGATSSARASPSCTRGSSRPARWIKGDTREGTKLVQALPLARRARPAAACRAPTPGREQLWSFIVPPGARNAGVEAEGAVVPQILLARDENRLAGEPALPCERQSVPRDLRPLRARERTARAGAGPLLRRRRDASGPQAGPVPPAPLDQRPHAARDHAGPARHRALRGRADASAWPTAAAASARPTSSCASTARRRTSPSRPTARCASHVGRLSTGRHRLEISASDLQETKNSENASALALPNTRTVHTAFTVDATG